MRKWIKIVTVLVASVSLLAACKEEKKIEKKEVIRPVKVKEIQTAVGTNQSQNFSGTSKGIKESVLSFRVSGVLQKLDAEVGDKVQNGQVVAALDDRDYQIAVTRFEGQLNSAIAQLDQLQKGARSEDIRILDSRIKSAQAAERTASSEYRRVQQLYAKDAAPKSRLDQAKTQWEQSREALRAAKEEKTKALAGGREEEIRAAVANVRSIRSNLSQAKANLEDTQLKIPFDGLISQKHISDFEQIQAGAPIYSLVNIQQIEVQISVPERLISLLVSGQTVDVHFLNFPGQTFSGTVTKVGVTADVATLTYPVFVEVANLEQKILPGMTAEVRIKIDQEGGAFPTVPIHSIQEDKVTKAKYVWVFDPTTSTVKRREIKLGRILYEEIEAIEGLKDGEKVIIAGVHRVSEGMKVRVPETQ